LKKAKGGTGEKRLKKKKDGCIFDGELTRKTTMRAYKEGGGGDKASTEVINKSEGTDDVKSDAFTSRWNGEGENCTEVDRTRNEKFTVKKDNGGSKKGLRPQPRAKGTEKKRGDRLNSWTTPVCPKVTFGGGVEEKWDFSAGAIDSLVGREK